MLLEGFTFETIINYGVFAALFVGLFVYMIKKNDEREKRYLEIIDNYAKSLETLSQSINANSAVIGRLAEDLEIK